MSAQRALPRAAAYISKKYEAYSRVRASTCSSVKPIAFSPSPALASRSSSPRGSRKKDSGGQATRGWLSTISRSSVVPERCTPTMKNGVSPVGRLSGTTMTRLVRRTSSIVVVRSWPRNSCASVMARLARLLFGVGGVVGGLLRGPLPASAGRAA